MTDDVNTQLSEQEIQNVLVFTCSCGNELADSERCPICGEWLHVEGIS